MTRLSLEAPAKINLTLDVLAKRPDGYHNIRSIMQTVGLYDTVDITHAPDRPGVSLEVIGPEAEGVPADQTNIVHKSAVRLQKTAAAQGTMPGNRSGLHIALTKRIPTQAGLGGGSSNAAAVLKALNSVFKLHLSPGRLTEIAATLGADVPFFLSGGTALVEGLGERVTPLAPFDFNGWIVIVKPPVGVATAHAYNTLDAVPDRIPGRATAEWESLKSQPLANDFQDIVLASYPEVADAFNAITRASGRRPLLCGSGAALFAFSQDERQAQNLAEDVGRANVGKVWVTQLHRGNE